MKKTNLPKNSISESQKMRDYQNRNFRSIREMCYALFDELGPNEVTLELVLPLAKKLKPDTKFDKSHLYYHRQHWKNARLMEADDIRPEYRREDLGHGIRGKYLEAYRSGTNLVLLYPDVAKAFPTEKAVNEALRSLMEIAQRTVR